VPFYLLLELDKFESPKLTEILDFDQVVADGFRIGEPHLQVPVRTHFSSMKERSAASYFQQPLKFQNGMDVQVEAWTFNLTCLGSQFC
jgi:hypothetical protein